MLSILVIDMLPDKTTGIADMLRRGIDRQLIPVTKVRYINTMSDLAAEAAKESFAYHAVIFAVQNARELHISAATKLRIEYPSLFILFILGDARDVQEVARPSIRVSGILFLPLDQARLYRALHEIYTERARAVGTGHFVVKNGAEQIFIDIGDIYFFESSLKKMRLKTKAQEIEFYASFEAVMAQVPEWFIRCHKGFVVNTRYIKSVDWNNMRLLLADKSDIPVSRGYKQAVSDKLDLMGGKTT